MDTGKVIDKVRKLRRHAESAQQLGNEAEAQAFAARVQEMLTTHKLSLSEVEWDADVSKSTVIERTVGYAEEFKFKKARILWEEKLAGIIAQAHFCRLCVGTKTNHLTFVGTEQDTEVCEFAFVTLHRLAAIISEREYCKYFWECDRQGQVHLARGYKANFLLGFLVRLRQRLDEQRERTQASSSLALTRLSTAITKVNRYFSEHYEQPGKMSRPLKHKVPVNSAGYDRGVQVADGVNLNRPVEGSPETRRLA